MSTTYKMLKHLKDSRTSLNTHQLDDFVNEDPDTHYVEKNTLYVNLHYLIGKGYVTNEGQHTCGLCCIASNNYRITEKGLMALVDMEVRYFGSSKREVKKEAER